MITCYYWLDNVSIVWDNATFPHMDTAMPRRRKNISQSSEQRASALAACGRLHGPQNRSQLDIDRICDLYAFRDRLNELEQPKWWNAWIVDHIQPLSQGGEHEIGNLRLLRHWANGPVFRDEREIGILRRAVISCLFEHAWPSSINWGCPTREQAERGECVQVPKVKS